MKNNSENSSAVFLETILQNHTFSLPNVTVFGSNSSTTTTTTTTTTLPSTVTIINNGFTVPPSNNNSIDNSTQPVYNITTALLSTTEAEFSVTEAAHTFQRKIWTSDGYGGYVPYDEQHSTPISILLLNFFLVIFLMIVIGIAVYPAVKKYCDSTFFSGNTRYWIEDNEEVVSVLTTNIPECSFALLNRNKEMERNTGVSPSSAGSMEPLIDVRAELT